MTEKKRTAKSKSRKVPRIPIPKITWGEAREVHADTNRWMRVRAKRVQNATIDELEYALQVKRETEQPWAPPATREARYGLLVRACAYAIDRDQRRKRRAGESASAYGERQRAGRTYQASGLAAAVKQIEPTAKSVAPRDIVKWLEGARANASPVHLAIHLAVLAQIWSGVNHEAMRKAERKTR